MLGTEFSYAGFHSSDQSTPSHNHQGTELVLIIEGSCRNRFATRNIATKQGDLIVIPPELKHKQINETFVKTLYIVFENRQDYFPSELRVIHTNNDKFLKTWFEQMLFLYQEKLLDQCRLLLPVILTRINFLENKIGCETEMPTGLTKAIHYLNSHYSEELEINKISAKYGLSPSYFNALFHRHLDISPSEYIKKIRMSHARQLLRNSRLSIAEISTQCGYQQAYYFGRIFRQVHNCTPKEYRFNQLLQYDLKIE